MLDSEIAIRWLVSRVKQPTFELGNGVGALGVIGRWLRRRRSDGRGRGVVGDERGAAMMGSERLLADPPGQSADFPSIWSNLPGDRRMALTALKSCAGGHQLASN